MDWILLQLKSQDSVSYIESSNSSMQNYLSYVEFLKFIAKYPVREWSEFKTEINKFSVILVNLGNGQWEVKNPSKTFKDFTFQQLYDLNVDPKKEENTLDSRYKKGKDFLRKYKK